MKGATNVGGSSRITELWLVLDPFSDLSAIEDVLVRVTPDELAKYVCGTGAREWTRRHHTMYLDEQEARQDAEERLRQVARQQTAHGEPLRSARNRARR